MAWNWSNAGTGAAGGAATGATVGSVIPGVGTAIGAGAGALLGGLFGGFGDPTGQKYDPEDREAFDLPGGAAMSQQAQNAYAAAQARNPNASPFRDQSLALMSQLRGQASGQGMGPAQMGAQQAMSQGMAAQMSQAAGARGFGGAAANLGAQRAMTALGTAGAGQQAQARAQDVQAAQGMLAQLAGQGRGQDMQAQGMQDDAMRQWLMSQLDISRAQQAGQLTREQLIAQAAAGDTGWLPYLMQGAGMVAQLKGGK